MSHERSNFKQEVTGHKNAHLGKAGLAAGVVLAAGAALGIHGSANAEQNVSPFNTSPVLNGLSLDNGQCPDLSGQDNGRIIDNQWLSQGIHTGATGNYGPDEMVVFDTNRSGTGFPDFEVNRGKFAVIPDNLDDVNQDGLIDGPSISPYGGTMYVSYDNPAAIKSVDIVDKDGSDPATVRLYGDNDVVLKTIPIPTEADGAVETVAINVSGVRRMEVTSTEDIAVGNIKCDAN